MRWAMAGVLVAALVVAYLATVQAVHTDLYGDGIEVDHG